jgi:hypothetical protein
MTQKSICNGRLQGHASTIAGLAAALVLTACASTPQEPSVAMNAAEQAIAAADRMRVADAASPELSEAREKFAAAHAAVQSQRMVDGERLALEARADAELASAKIEASKAIAVNDEMKHSTDTLTQEMQRSSGVKQ